MTAKRVLISIDERLLARIDQAVERRGLTRSGYLARLASADLDGQHGPVTSAGSSVQQARHVTDDDRA